MKLRSIVIMSAIGALALSACCGKVENTAKPKKDICVQLYSLRSLIKGPESISPLLDSLAKLGYTGVEAAGYGDGKFYGLAPEEFKAKVEAAGLKLVSSHVSNGLSEAQLDSGDFSGALAWWDECIAAHKAAGTPYMVTPWMGTQKSLEHLQVYCDYLNAVGKKCAEVGIAYGYHNHDYEFRKVADTDVVMYDYMVEHTDPAYVFMQLDVYWAMWGHVSPVDYFKRYPGRFKMLHIKDEREIGQSGMVGFDAIFKNADIAGLECYIVEIERYSYENVLVSAKESIDYLLDAPFVKASYK